MSGIGVAGKACTAGTLQPDGAAGKALLPQFGHLPAESLLVALAQPEVVVVEDVAAEVVAHPRRAYVPAAVHGQQEVAGQCHNGQFHHQMEEDLVAVLDDDVVGKAAVVAQTLADVALELAVQVVHSLGQPGSLLRRPAGQEAVGHIAGLPVAELLHVVPDAEALQRQAVEGGEVESGKHLRELNAEHQPLGEAVDELVQEVEQHGVLELAADAFLHQAVVDVGEVVVDVQLHMVVDLLLAAPAEFGHLLTDEEVGALARHAGGAAVVEGVEQPPFHREHGRPLDDVVADGRLLHDAVLRLEHFFGDVGGGVVGTFQIGPAQEVEVFVQPFFKLLDGAAAVLAGRVAVEGSPEVVLRGHVGGYVSFSFHGRCLAVSSGFVCFFFSLPSAVPFARLPALLRSVCSTMGCGLVSKLRCGKLTNRPHGKVEGRAVVRIGRRDTIVHIQVLKAGITAIVRITTTGRHPQAGDGSRNDNRGEGEPLPPQR